MDTFSDLLKIVLTLGGILFLSRLIRKILPDTLTGSGCGCGASLHACRELEKKLKALDRKGRE